MSLNPTEFAQLLYDTVRTNSEYKAATGATATDPRIYRSKRPAKTVLSSTKPAYSVYYHQGSVRTPWESGPSDGGLDDRQYVIEVYAKDILVVEAVCGVLVSLFDKQRFSTSNYFIHYVRANEGPSSFETGRKEYRQDVIVYMSKVWEKLP
jgi:hypothetical protein